MLPFLLLRKVTVMSAADRSPKQSAATLLVRSLENQGVKFIFGIPGGKIMPTFDVLNDGGPKLILCRHEQNAAFMAAAVGRLTGRPGVCLVTSGPGTGNLVTGAATATTEGDPMVAIGGSVGRTDALKQTHQTLDSVAMMKPVTKYSVAINAPETTGEVVANAFRAAMTPRAGAAFIAFPQDVQSSETDAVAPSLNALPSLGPAASDLVTAAANKLRQAENPVLLLGMGASEPEATAAIRRFLAAYPMPVVGTFQGAGAVSRELVELFYGRIGLFRNQPGDKVLAHADVVMTVGYDPVEYGPEAWNARGSAAIIHVDDYPCDIDSHYQPEVELRGDVASTLDSLLKVLGTRTFTASTDQIKIHGEWAALQKPAVPTSGSLIHPLAFVSTLRSILDDDTIVASDIGSNYIWMARHYFDFEPRKLLFSNGQQTLGVGIPWAIAASLLYPNKKVVATVGDAGFLYSSMDLETAVREKVNMTVFVFRDGTYNMVAFQQENIYGRTSGIAFGPTDFVKYAESLGAVGLRVTSRDDLESTMRSAIERPGVIVVDVPVDYSMNTELGRHVIPNSWD
jgi:acetolactate synthase-1/2/3 large subunit